MSKRYLFPLAVQVNLPDDFSKNEEFRQELAILQELGFSGLELNIAEPEKVRLSVVRDFLKQYELNFTLFASGLTAKRRGLSLSHDDQTVRHKSIDTLKRIIDWLADSGTGIILGFFKGPRANDSRRAGSLFRNSLAALVPHTDTRAVDLLVEATNRYESSVANTLEEAVRFVRETESSRIKILPDTFHMNIEESDSCHALTQYSEYYSAVHFSDNNRFFPGFGAIDFKKIVAALKAVDYRGKIGIEGNIKRCFMDDIRSTMIYLEPLLL